MALPAKLFPQFLRPLIDDACDFALFDPIRGALWRLKVVNRGACSSVSLGAVLRSRPFEREFVYAFYVNYWPASVAALLLARSRMARSSSGGIGQISTISGSILAWIGF